MGLPTLSLAFMALLIDVPSAMALVLVPAFITNLWQALAGGHLGILTRRIWPFLLIAFVCTGLGGIAMVNTQTWMLTCALGIVLAIYSTSLLCGLKFRIGVKSETKYGILFGACNGVVTGLTGTFGIPGVQYLQSIGLGKDQMVQAMGILFLISSLGMGISLLQNSYLSIQLGKMSVIALFPALAGMIIGQKIRAKTPEPVFRSSLLVVLLFLGIYLFVTGANKGELFVVKSSLWNSIPYKIITAHQL